MSLSIGIVGLPNVGKSTLFNALTKNKAEAANYPFCTIDPNVGVVKVPDGRLAKLAAISKPAKIIPAAIEFVDIAGLARGAHKGEGLGNQFLSHIRECDAICEVVRNFQNESIIHVDGKIDPVSDKETINLELIFADLSTIEKRLAKVEREAKTGGKEMILLKELLGKLKSHLEDGRAAREFAMNEEEILSIKELNLLTWKPILYVINISDDQAVLSGDDLKKWGKDVITLNARLEEEISNLPDEEKAEYIKELGLAQSGLDKLAKASYTLLGLQTFFTTGADETRAWTIKIGAKAPQAAGAIHTDFEKGFIRAEVINWEKFIEAGSEARARDLGWMRTEGKDYTMQDGDVCNFLFSK